MIFLRRSQSKTIDTLTRGLADDMRWAAQGRGATIWLYAEVDAAMLDGMMVVIWDDGRTMTQTLRMQARALIRNLWSEFRLNGRDRWRAIVVKASSSGQQSISYIYDDMFDSLAGYDKRVRRWMARTVPVAIGVTPVIPDDLE